MNSPSFDELRHVAALSPAIAAVTEAAASGAGILLVGPPSIATTMIARRIAPLLGEGAAFRAPHYTVSHMALLGSADRPGEYQLSRGGVFYLDEVEEFTRATIIGLGAMVRVDQTARPLIVASTRPCPCGQPMRCGCTEEAIDRHRVRVRQGARELGLAVTVNLPALSLADLRGDRAVAL